MNCCTCVNSRTSFWYSSALATNIQSESIKSNRSLMFCLSSTFYCCRCPYLSLLITRRVIILRRMWRRRFKRLISSKIGSPQPFIASERKGAFARSRLSSLDKSPSKIQSDGGGTNRSLTDRPTAMDGRRHRGILDSHSFATHTAAQYFCCRLKNEEDSQRRNGFGWDKSQC